MQRFLLIFSLLFLSVAATAQVVFKTIVTKGPVAVGESFPVQFVLEDIDDPRQEFHAPDFKNFRFVSGPYIYYGSVEGPAGLKSLKNIMYTLEAVKPGKFRIAGASALVNNNFIISDDAWVEVIPRAEAVRLNKQGVNADYFLKPGEEPYQKIRNNLFMKVMVDKTTCFAGEPVTATYKLYSRLISKSAIVKNPGFYGFTVHDMIGLNDKQADIETINGKKFDVHTIRKVQLYPLRPGQFVIDPMEVSNKVEFSRTIVSRKSEQEIIEGVVTEKDEPAALNAEEYENSMRTEPVIITVKSSPEKNQPDDFTGATGKFSVNAVVNKNELARNEEGQLMIEISGRGNFTQLTAPVIQWPEGVEGFDPKITDTLDQAGSPLKGKRTFIFSFVSAKSGTYSIPAIGFSFFDPDSNRYKTVSTQVQTITINGKEKKSGQELVVQGDSVQKSSLLTWVVIIALLSAMAGCFFWFRKKRKPQVKVEPSVGNAIPAVSELLEPAAEFSGEDKLFYTILRQCIWNFFTLHFGLTGSRMNSRDLLVIMKNRSTDEKIKYAILDILQECETGMFADAHIETNRDNLLKKTQQNLESLIQ